MNMRQLVLTLTLTAILFSSLPSPVVATGAAQPAPVRPGSPAATIMRAESLIALRMLQDEYPVPIYLVEIDGADYTVVLTDAGSEMMRRSGRTYLLGVPGRIGIRVDVTSMDASEVSCSIFDADGERIAEDGSGMIAQCWVQ
jgi:hypothetical protein